MGRLRHGEIESVTWSTVKLCMFTFVGNHGEIESVTWSTVILCMFTFVGNHGEIESVTWSMVNLCMFTFVGNHGEIESVTWSMVPAGNGGCLFRWILGKSCQTYGDAVTDTEYTARDKRSRGESTSFTRLDNKTW